MHFAALAGSLGLLGTAFWAAMLLYCIFRDREERHIWIFVILFLNIIGALAYFAVRVVPQLGLYDRLVAGRERRRQVERVEGQIAHLGDRPHLWGELGRLRFEGGDLAGAEEALEKALATEDDAAYRFDLARVAAAQGRLAEAVKLLTAIVARDPDHAYGDAKRLLARTLVELGRDAEARPAARRARADAAFGGGALPPRARARADGGARGGPRRGAADPGRGEGRAGVRAAARGGVAKEGAGAREEVGVAVFWFIRSFRR